MLKIKNGKEKTQIFTILICDKCGAEFIYISEKMKSHVKDKYIDDDIYTHSDDCMCCRHKLRKRELPHNKYSEELKDLKFTSKQGTTYNANEDDIFVYI